MAGGTFSRTRGPGKKISAQPTEFPTSLGGLLAAAFRWAFRHPLPPAVSAAVIVLALGVCALPFVFPTWYAATLKGTLPDRYAVMAGEFAGSMTRELNELRAQLTEERNKLAEKEAGRSAVTSGGPLRVRALFETSIQEPWVGAIHNALTKAQKHGKIQYDYRENISPAEMAALAKEAADQQYDLIIGDAFNAERPLRLAAREYPLGKPAFVFGSSLGPSNNFSVFDNWIHEPAYAAGMIAATLSTSRTVGIVAGKSLPEVNRVVNAFINGARKATADVKVLVEFTGDWDRTDIAEQKAQQLMLQGADVLYAERDGVIEACEKSRKLAIGNMVKQDDMAPATVVASVVWDLEPMILRIIAQIQGGTYVAEDFGSWSRMYKDGSQLSSFPLEGRWKKLIREEKLKEIERIYYEIKEGVYRVDVVETDPQEYLRILASRDVSSPLSLTSDASGGGIPKP